VDGSCDPDGVAVAKGVWDGDEVGVMLDEVLSEVDKDIRLVIEGKNEGDANALPVPLGDTDDDTDVLDETLRESLRESLPD